MNFWQSASRPDDDDRVPADPATGSSTRDVTSREILADIPTEILEIPAEPSTVDTRTGSLPTMAQLEELSGELDQIDAALARMDAESPLPRPVAR